MSTRHLYLARHGRADAFGHLTADGLRQSHLLGRRLAAVPVDTVWHSPLDRAAACAFEVGRSLPGVPLAAAPELIDHVPYVPAPEEMPPAWAGFFDGYDEAEADAGRRIADSLVARFAEAPVGTRDTHQVLITHTYPIAWLLRHAIGAPASRWLGLNSANTALTVIEYRDGQAPSIVMFNDSAHLPPELRWTGFPTRTRP